MLEETWSKKQQDKSGVPADYYQILFNLNIISSLYSNPAEYYSL